MSAGLSNRVKVGYGAAELGQQAFDLVLALYLLNFYTGSVGLSPQLAGLALGLGVLWDAVSDPVMGVLLDRTRTRLGRFVPYLALGAPLTAAAAYLLFRPPAEFGAGGLFAWLLGGFLLVNTGLTLLGVPHVALASALTRQRDERTTLYAWRLAFGALGLLGVVFLPLALGAAEAQSEAQEGAVIARTVSLAAVATLVATLVTILAVRRAPQAETEVEVFSWRGVLKGFADTLRNPYFRPLLVSFLVIEVARAFNGATALFYYEYRLDLDFEVVLREVLGVFFALMLLGVGLWTWLSRRLGKKWPAFAGVVTLGAAGSVAYPLFPPGETTGPIFMAVLGGFLVGAVVLYDSLVADTVDYDELQSGQRREGMYFGFWRMSTKVARALSLGMAGLVLGAIGFEEGAETQSEGTRWGLALLFGPGVGFFFMLAGVIFAFMPLTRARHAEIQRQLEERRDAHD